MRLARKSSRLPLRRCSTSKWQAIGSIFFSSSVIIIVTLGHVRLPDRKVSEGAVSKTFVGSCDISQSFILYFCRVPQATLIDRLVTCGMCDQFLLIKFSFSFNLLFSPRLDSRCRAPGFSWQSYFFVVNVAACVPPGRQCWHWCFSYLCTVTRRRCHSPTLKRSSFPYPFILYQPATDCWNGIGQDSSAKGVRASA